MDTNFVWTDELVSDFTQRVLDKWGGESKQQIMEDFKKAMQPKPLFTTEDNVEIYEGDGFWGVDEKFNLNKNMTFHNFKYFSKKEAAIEYLLINKPCLSVNDVLSISDATFDFLKIHAKRLRELVKLKINIL